MGKQKQRTAKVERKVTEVEETEEISFEQFERTLKKLVRSKPPKEETSNDKRKRA